MSVTRRGVDAPRRARGAGAHPPVRMRDEEAAGQARLAAIGRVTAGVVHDFNNIVSVISLCGRLLESQEGLDESGREQVAHIRREADRAASLVWQILDFAHDEPIARAPVDLDRFFADFLPVLRRAQPVGISVGFSNDGADHRVMADAGRLEQIVTNLATNASDAMPTTGRIEISLVREGRRVGIDVADTGAGVPPEVLPRIFEPFFSTKRAAHGTGLGLAQVHSLVAQHDGDIDVTSTVGEGTRFTVWFPALHAA